MSFDYNDILTPEEYIKKAKITKNAYHRRVNSKVNPIIFNEYDIEFVKKNLDSRYDIALARAIYSNEKVKLISLKSNPIGEVKRGRPRAKLI